MGIEMNDWEEENLSDEYAEEQDLSLSNVCAGQDFNGVTLDKVNYISDKSANPNHDVAFSRQNKTAEPD